MYATLYATHVQGGPQKIKPHLLCCYVVNNTIFMCEDTAVFCMCSYNHIVYVLLSNIKYSMTRISTNWDESTLSSTVCIIFPMTKRDVNGIHNNSLKYYVLVWHSNPTATSFIRTLWYNFWETHTHTTLFTKAWQKPCRGLLFWATLYIGLNIIVCVSKVHVCFVSFRSPNM